MRVAAIDWGKVRIGVAVSDERGVFAQPRPALDGRNVKKVLSVLTELVRGEGIERFIVGLPLNMAGTEGPAAARARQFAQRLADATGLEVELFDERLTTVQAARDLRDAGIPGKRARASGGIDSAAAAILLQTWLDRRAWEAR